MNIGIIGVGVVGGATGKVLETKHQVRYYDKFKPGLSHEENLEAIARESEIAFICVPTPMKPSGEMDYSTIYSSLDQLLAATQTVGRPPEELITIIRSTAVSGTTDDAARKFPFQFAFNPEFLREKYAEEDMQNTTRITLGARSPHVHNMLMMMYSSVFPNATYNCISTKDAEMVKYARNVMLAGQIGIANELHRVCQAIGVDYQIVKESMLEDTRIGRNIDVPGHDGDFGFGGKCFPKDLRAFTYLAREHNVEPYLLDEVWRSNLNVRKSKDWLDIKGATTNNNF